jgi:hypothetical protein
VISEQALSSANPVAGEPAGDFVDFYPSGTRAAGDFRCAECAYGVFVVRELPRCPMCGQHVWERVAWRPFTRLRP